MHWLPVSRRRFDRLVSATLLLAKGQRKLKERINTMANTVDSLKADAAALQTKEAALETKIATDVAAILKVIEDLKAALSSNIAVTQADLDILAGHISAVSAGLDKVGSSVDAVVAPPAPPAPTPTV